MSKDKPEEKIQKLEEKIEALEKVIVDLLSENYHVFVGGRQSAIDRIGIIAGVSNK